MNKLQLPQAKLLYAVSQVYRKRRIDQTEKRILKEKIITDNIEIFEILEQNEDQNDVFDKIVALVRKPEESKPESKKDEEVRQEANDEPSSPWGEFLRRKKVNNSNKHKGQTNALKSFMNPQKAE